MFPELNKQADFVTKVVKEEEECIFKNLDKGINRFNIYTSAGKDLSNQVPDPINLENEDDIRKMSDQHRFLKQRQSKIVAGEFAFELNDTYGFPIDLLHLWLRKSIGQLIRQDFNRRYKYKKTEAVQLLQ